MIYSIYLITNKVNTKLYIGVTGKEIIERFKEHCRSARYNSKSLLHKAMRKNGIENFRASLLVTYPSKKEALEEEKKYIARLKTKIPYGYNLTCGGEGLDEFKYNRKQKQELVKMLRKRWANPEFREKRDKSLRKAMKNPEVSKKISLACKNMWKNPEIRIRILAGHKKYYEEHPEALEKVRRQGVENNPNAKKVKVKGIIYFTGKAAAKVLGISAGTLVNRLQSVNFPDHQYV